MSSYMSYQVEKVREERTIGMKHPFPHQVDAFSALSRTLPTPITGYKGTMLVLPTGGGKTFTSVNWICRNILSRGIKVLWLAQSTTLLDQAAQTFKSELHTITGRDTINIRVVSGSDHHSNAGSIVPTDDIVICTTQTAIRAYSTEAFDSRGNIRHTPFRTYLDSFSDTEFFVVVDEAHHTPAFGCRSLLLSMRANMQHLYVLGLTATPTHNDERISGWLWKIYDKGICYEADINVLQTNNILAVPKYIEKQTGIELEVDDDLYRRLTIKHRDLPEKIIERLANDSVRNNYIVSDYVSNQNIYGKTLIFADRWFQCEYIVEKLKSKGIRANAVYSKIENSDTLFVDGSGRRSNKDNEKIMRDFREGKYDVIVNVRMLTEGVDVPDVKTIMITRQTTSPILFTQMVGRALRGTKAGGGEGKEQANIVLFMDSWKRLLIFVNPKGDTQPGRPPRQGRNPYDSISIHLVRNLSADISYTMSESIPYLNYIPVGWYAAEYTVSIEEGGAQELIAAMESILIYDFNQNKYDELLEYLLKESLVEWADESLEDKEMFSIASSLAVKFFNESDDLDGKLQSNIVHLIRHISQNGEKPKFLNFNERLVYDLDKIARDLVDTSARECILFLANLFNNEGLLWRTLYKDFINFKKAYDHAINRYLIGSGTEFPQLNKGSKEINSILTEEIRQQVFKRDNNKCICCGKEKRRGVSLEIDHILPIAMGGKNVPSNLQALCKRCNGIKGVNEIDYRSNVSPLSVPKEMVLFDATDSDSIESAVARIVNHIYHCGAFSSLESSQRSNGKNYHTWILNLYHGNDPRWLEMNAARLLVFINEDLGWTHVEGIVIKG